MNTTVSMSSITYVWKRCPTQFTSVSPLPTISKPHSSVTAPTFSFWRPPLTTTISCPIFQPSRTFPSLPGNYIRHNIQLLFFWLAWRVELNFMQPTVVDQIFHFPVSVDLEPDLSASRQAIVWIVLIIFVALAILADTLSIEPLILEFLSHISVWERVYLRRLPILLLLAILHSLIMTILYLICPVCATDRSSGSELLTNPIPSSPANRTSSHT